MKNMKKALSLVCACILLCALLPSLAVSAAAPDVIDNSDLLPAYRPDSQVALVDNGTPDWAAGAIIAEVRAETSNGSPWNVADGTFDDVKRVVDHYAEVGVNVIWLNPIAERDAFGVNDSMYNGYSGYGPHTIAASLAGTTDQAAARAELKELVDYAHSKNVRILLDIVTWGVATGAPLYSEHPEYFSSQSGWGGPAFNWSSNSAAIQFFVNTLTQLAVDTGIDGYRCDVEPGTSGYVMYGKVRASALAAGRKLLIMSEHESTRTNNGELVYDLGQWGVNASDGSGHGMYMTEYNQIFMQNNIVDLVKNGQQIGLQSIWQNGGTLSRFYTFQMTCHDHGATLVNGNGVYAGYSAMFTPFIPLFWIGEEWNNPKNAGGTSVLYFNHINWGKKETNRAFFEQFKKYVRIRREHPDIFEYYAPNIKNANICAVTTAQSSTQPQSYARYANGKAIVVVPNVNATGTSNVTATIPWDAAGLSAGGTYVVTDLMTGEQIASGTKQTLSTFSGSVPALTTGAFLVAPEGTWPPAEEGTDAFVAEKQFASVKASDFAANNSHHIGGIIKWLDKVGGGVHVCLTAVSSARLGVHYNKELKIDGTHFIIDNLDCSKASTAKLAFLLGATPGADFSAATLVEFSADGNVYNHTGGGSRLTNNNVIKAMYTGKATLFSFTEEEGVVTVTATNDAGSASFELGGYGSEWIDHSKGYINIVTQSATGAHEFDITAFHSGDESCGVPTKELFDGYILADTQMYPSSLNDWTASQEYPGWWGPDGGGYVGGSYSGPGFEKVMNANGSVHLYVGALNNQRFTFSTAKQYVLDGAHMIIGDVQVNNREAMSILLKGAGDTWLEFRKSGHAMYTTDSGNYNTPAMNGAASPVVSAMFDNNEVTVLEFAVSGTDVTVTLINTAGTEAVTFTGAVGSGSWQGNAVSAVQFGFCDWIWADETKSDIQLDIYALHGGDEKCVAKEANAIQEGENLKKKLSAAAAGSTVSLKGNALTDTVIVKPGVTLDLNGYTLTADYFVSFGNVVDGALKTAKDNVMLSADNAALPVWNGESYMFVAAPTFQQQSEVKDGTVVYTFLPTFNASVHEYLAAGAESSNVTVTVRLTWTPRTGGTAVQDFVYGDTFVKDVVDSYNGSNYTKAYTLAFNNASKLNNLQYSVVVVSGTGVSFAP